MGASLSFWPPRCVIVWEEFEKLLSSHHPVRPGAMAQALKSTIDLTVSGHVSIFEFDIFTRLFQVSRGPGVSDGPEGPMVQSA